MSKHRYEDANAEISKAVDVTDEASVEEVEAESVNTPEVAGDAVEVYAPSERVGVTDPMATATYIELIRNYGGTRTGEVRLPPGVYTADDLRKYGGDFPEYLVANGHARWSVGAAG
jgi:hypothetical protein